MVNAIGLIIGTAIGAVIAIVGLALMNTMLPFLGIGNGATGGYGATASGSAGLWGLLPLLFPFMVIAVLLIGIFALFRQMGD